jgi:DNA-binding PadR family transcriptional regulator
MKEKEISRPEEMVLLTIRRLGDGAYGVTIKRAIQEVADIDMPYGTLYFLLDQLATKGLVDRTTGEPTPERGGRRKTYYRVSPAGLAALDRVRELHRQLWAGLADEEVTS